MSTELIEQRTVATPAVSSTEWIEQRSRHAGEMAATWWRGTCSAALSAKYKMEQQTVATRCRQSVQRFIICVLCLDVMDHIEHKSSRISVGRRALTTMMPLPLAG